MSSASPSPAMQAILDGERERDRALGQAAATHGSDLDPATHQVTEDGRFLQTVSGIPGAPTARTYPASAGAQSREGTAYPPAFPALKSYGPTTVKVAGDQLAAVEALVVGIVPQRGDELHWTDKGWYFPGAHLPLAEALGSHPKLAPQEDIDLPAEVIGKRSGLVFIVYQVQYAGTDVAESDEEQLELQRFLRISAARVHFEPVQSLQELLVLQSLQATKASFTARDANDFWRLRWQSAEFRSLIAMVIAPGEFGRKTPAVYHNWPTAGHYPTSHNFARPRSDVFGTLLKPQ